MRLPARLSRVLAVTLAWIGLQPGSAMGQGLGSSIFQRFMTDPARTQAQLADSLAEAKKDNGGLPDYVTATLGKVPVRPIDKRALSDAVAAYFPDGRFIGLNRSEFDASGNLITQDRDTLFHEAFHAYFDNLASPADKKAIRADAVQSYGRRMRLKDDDAQGYADEAMAYYLGALTRAYEEAIRDYRVHGSVNPLLFRDYVNALAGAEAYGVVKNHPAAIPITDTQKAFALKAAGSFFPSGQELLSVLAKRTGVSPRPRAAPRKVNHSPEVERTLHSRNLNNCFLAMMELTGENCAGGSVRRADWGGKDPGMCDSYQCRGGKGVGRLEAVEIKHGTEHFLCVMAGGQTIPYRVANNSECSPKAGESGGLHCLVPGRRAGYSLHGFPFGEETGCKGSREFLSLNYGFESTGSQVRDFSTYPAGEWNKRGYPAPQGQSVTSELVANAVYPEKRGQELEDACTEGLASALQARADRAVIRLEGAELAQHLDTLQACADHPALAGFYKRYINLVRKVRPLDGPAAVSGVVQGGASGVGK